MKGFKYALAMSVVLWGASVASVSATEYVDVNVTVVANNEILLDSTEYITTDGCTVTDALGTEYQVEGAKAVCALYSAAQAEGLGLSFTDYGGDFGLLITGIGDVQTNIDLEWYWLYYLNGGYPIGVSNQEVASGDNLVFTYGYWTAAGAPLTLELSDTQVVADEFVTATVQLYDGERYVPAEGATVFVNDWEYTTNERGHIKFGVPRKGVKQVHAELEDYTRTPDQEVRIYKRSKEKKAVSVARRTKMARRALDSLTTKAGKRAVTASPSLRDWAVMALAANEQKQEAFVSGSLTYKAQVMGMSTEIARNVLALSSAGNTEDAQTKADQLVDMQEACDDGYINDEIYSVLAWQSVENKQYTGAVKKNVRCALASQKRGGGVPLSTNGTADIDTTAAYVQMLSSVETPKTFSLKKKRVNRAQKKALAYLRRHQNPDGGWGYAAGETSNSSTTAYALMAFQSADKKPGRVRTNKRNGFNFLKRTQRKSGAFRYDKLGTQSVEELNTAYASMALLKTYLPVNHVQ